MTKLKKVMLVFSLLGSASFSKPAYALNFFQNAHYCLLTCKKDYCEESQNNFQSCLDRCRGRYQGLIKSCKQAGITQGFKDEQISQEEQTEEEDEVNDSLPASQVDEEKEASTPSEEESPELEEGDQGPSLEDESEEEEELDTGSDA